jgi:hypothetical protein
MEFVEKKLENNENSQEYILDQYRYRIYVRKNPLDSMRLFEPIHVEVSVRVLGFVITYKTN